MWSLGSKMQCGIPQETAFKVVLVLLLCHSASILTPSSQAATVPTQEDDQSGTTLEPELVTAAVLKNQEDNLDVSTSSENVAAEIFQPLDTSITNSEVTDFNTKIINQGGSSSKPIDVLTGTKQCRCGQKLSTTIVDGTAISTANYPWTAAVVDASTHKLFCGGSLITDRHVLTASHCVQSYRKIPEDIYIVLRQSNITPEILASSKAKTFLKVPVEQIIMHEKYNPFTVDNDVAILKLKKPVRIFDITVVPVCLPTSNSDSFAGRTGTVVGWGSMSEISSDSSPVLQKVEVPIMANYDCVTMTDTHHYAGKVNDNMLCAGHLEGRKDACQGDSGGPLTITDDGNSNRQVLVGVVSWGVGCARPRSPGVYARVGRYIDWIQSKIEGGNMCSN